MLYFLKEVYAKNLTEMTNTKDSEGLSAADKMEMNMSKLDVGILDMSEINVESTLERLRKHINVPISDEEIQYYRDHHNPSDIQIHLFRSFYASSFMSYRDLCLIDRREYNELLLLLKKHMLLESGYDDYEKEMDVVLPYIITGNLDGKVNTRTIRNTKLMAKLEENSTYQYLIHDKYRELENMKPGYIKNFISMFINTNFTYVSYENPEMTGKPIVASEEKICDELLLFLKEV